MKCKFYFVLVTQWDTWQEVIQRHVKRLQTQKTRMQFNRWIKVCVTWFLTWNYKKNKIKCIDIIQFHYKYKRHWWQETKQVSSSNSAPQTCPALRLKLHHLPTAVFFSRNILICNLKWCIVLFTEQQQGTWWIQGLDTNLKLAGKFWLVVENGRVVFCC